MSTSGDEPRSKPITLSIDAMGGDHGPAAVVAGMEKSARKNEALHFILHGPKDELEPLVQRRKLQDRCEIRDVGGVVSMTDKPSHVMRHGKGTSMWSAIESATPAR
jgi:glycerol-3-phosphate acyltransferase PlsX